LCRPAKRGSLGGEVKSASYQEPDRFALVWLLGNNSTGEKRGGGPVGYGSKITNGHGGGNHGGVTRSENVPKDDGKREKEGAPDRSVDIRNHPSRPKARLSFLGGQLKTVYKSQ